MKAKHTPGPWTMRGPSKGVGIYTIGNERIDVCDLTGEQDTEQQELADGRLIAAAPDLYAAMNRIFELADDSENRMPEDLDAIADEARAAISRVEGK